MNRQITLLLAIGTVAVSFNQIVIANTVDDIGNSAHSSLLQRVTHNAGQQSAELTILASRVGNRRERRRDIRNNTADRVDDKRDFREERRDCVGDGPDCRSDNRQDKRHDTADRIEDRVDDRRDRRW